jgi:hypothetical protein
MVVPVLNKTSRRARHRSDGRRAGRSGRCRRRPLHLELDLLETRTLPSGTWLPLANLAPGDTGTMLLLSDGTVMIQGGLQFANKTWYGLTPDPFGSYLDATWSQLASMSLERLDFPSNVLSDGRVLVLGGEYTGPSNEWTRTNTGEIYDPTTDAWAPIQDFPKPYLGDDPTEVLPGGTVLAGSPTDYNTYIYDPLSGNWSFAANKPLSDSSGEETWVKLPDDSILSYDVWADGGAERYVPSENQWVATGSVPAALSGPAVDNEIGPAFLLPDGRAFFLGATGQTASYTLATNSWTAGPVIPHGLAAADAPGAMMPDGKILFAANPPISNGQFFGPTKIFEFDPATNSYTDVTPAGYDLLSPPYTTRMLLLPSGQVLLTDGGDQLLLYTPDGSPAPAWQPQISQVTANPDGTYTLKGTQLNGFSQGASFGDDAEMDSNYPIVQLLDQSGHLYDARTFDWSSTGVATGSTVVSTQFALPPGFLPGSYALSVVANGIASNPVKFTYIYSSATSLTASAPAPTYGQAESFTATVTPSGTTAFLPTGTVQFVIDGIEFGPPVTLVNGAASSLSTTTLAAGTHSVTAVYSGDPNFAAGSGNRLQPIEQAILTVTATSESMTYGGAVPVLAYSFSGLADGGPPASVFLGALGTSATSSSSVGEYPITQGTLVANPNYTVSFTPAVLTITPATLYIQAHDESMYFGGAVPALSYSASGLVSGDAARSVVSGALATTAASTSSPGIYLITQGTLVASADYTISFQAGALTVEALPPPVTLFRVQLQSNKQHLVSRVILAFSGALGAAEAAELGLYRLTSAGKHGSFTARSSRVIKLRSASYSAGNDTITLIPRVPFALSRPVQLLVRGTAPSGLLDAFGRLIDGTGDGQPGGDAVAILSRGGVTFLRSLN